MHPCVFIVYHPSPTPTVSAHIITIGNMNDNTKKQINLQIRNFLEEKIPLGQFEEAQKSFPAPSRQVKGNKST